MDVSGVLGSIRSGGFQNPIRNGIGAALNSITIPTVGEMTGLATAQAAVSGLPVPNAGAIQAAQTSIVNAVNQMNALLGHTDRISGVNLTGNGTLATIAKTASAARKINGEATCSGVLKAFGALHKTTEMVNEALATVAMVQSLLADIPRQIAQIPSQLAAYAEKVAEQITADTAALAQAQLDVVQHAVANHMVDMLGDECLSEIAAAVMTQPMRNEVDKVREKTLNTIYQSRYGTK